MPFFVRCSVASPEKLKKILQKFDFQEVSSMGSGLKLRRGFQLASFESLLSLESGRSKAELANEIEEEPWNTQEKWIEREKLT